MSADSSVEATPVIVEAHAEVVTATAPEEHKSHWTHQVVGAAAAFEATKAYEERERKDGKPASHALAKELIAAFSVAAVDKLFETKGLDFIDKEKAKHAAKKEAEAAIKADAFTQ